MIDYVGREGTSYEFCVAVTFFFFDKNVYNRILNYKTLRVGWILFEKKEAIQDFSGSYAPRTVKKGKDIVH